MVTRRFALCQAVAAIATLAQQAASSAAEVEQTIIHVKDMHCTDCAKKIASKLYAVPGVVGVRAIVKDGVAYITPQAAKQPSPRALWEAVESAEFQPIRIAGPGGTHTTKPKR